MNSIQTISSQTDLSNPQTERNTFSDYSIKIISYCPIIGSVTSTIVSGAINQKISTQCKEIDNYDIVYSPVDHSFTFSEEGEQARGYHIELNKVQNEYRFIDGVRWTITAVALALLSKPIIAGLASLFSGFYFLAYYVEVDIEQDKLNIEEQKNLALQRARQQVNERGTRQTGHIRPSATDRTSECVLQ